VLVQQRLGAVGAAYEMQIFPDEFARESRSYHRKIFAIFAIFARIFLTWHPPKRLQNVFAKLLF
jgi:hypothetical protein